MQQALLAQTFIPDSEEFADCSNIMSIFILDRTALVVYSPCKGTPEYVVQRKHRFGDMTESFFIDFASAMDYVVRELINIRPWRIT